MQRSLRFLHWNEWTKDLERSFQNLHLCKCKSKTSGFVFQYSTTRRSLPDRQVGIHGGSKAYKWARREELQLIYCFIKNKKIMTLIICNSQLRLLLLLKCLIITTILVWWTRFCSVMPSRISKPQAKKWMDFQLLIKWTDDALL